MPHISPTLPHHSPSLSQGTNVQVGFDPDSHEYIAPRQPSPYLRALFNYIKALNSMDYEGIMASFDERLVHTILPQVLKKPVLGYHNYGKYVLAVLEMFTHFQVQIHEVVEENHKMTVQATARGAGASGRPYLNEFILIIHFVPYDAQEMRSYGGPYKCPENRLPKMIKVKEFVDSESTAKWFKEERQWAKEQQQQGNTVQGSSRQWQGQGPSSQGYPSSAPTSVSASTSQGQGYLRPPQGYPSSSSYRPVHRDRYSGV